MKKKQVLIISVIAIILLFGIGVLLRNKSLSSKENNDNLDINITLDTDETVKDDVEVQANNESSNENETENDKEVIIDNESENSDNLEIITTSSQEKEPEKPKECQHTYNKQVVASTCTTDGSITYTCSKCNHSYQDVIKAEHEYGKYLCEKCGKLDPQADECWAMSAWLHRYGQLNGAETMYCYPYAGASLSIACHLDLNTIYFDYSDESTGEQFMVSIHNTSTCHVSYAMGRTRAYFSVPSSSLSSSMTVVFDEFYTPEEDPMDEAELALLCASKIDNYMQRFQNEILYPNVGIGLSTFGFRY